MPEKVYCENCAKLKWASTTSGSAYGMIPKAGAENEYKIIMNTKSTEAYCLHASGDQKQMVDTWLRQKRLRIDPGKYRDPRELNKNNNCPHYVPKEKTGHYTTPYDPTISEQEGF